MATNQRSVAPESACSAPRRQRKPFCQRVALREPPPPPPPTRERARHGAQGAWCGCARFMRTDRRRPRGSSARPRRGAPRRARSAQISAWARAPPPPSPARAVAPSHGAHSATSEEHGRGTHPSWRPRCVARGARRQSTHAPGCRKALTVHSAQPLRNIQGAGTAGRRTARAWLAPPAWQAGALGGRSVKRGRAGGARAGGVAHAFPPYQSPLQVLVGHLPRAPRALRRGLGRRAARERGGTRRGGAGERGVTSSRARVAPSGGPQARARSSRQGTVDRSKAGGASEKPPVGGRALRGW